MTTDTGKVALITGSGRGIGKGIALRLARDGYNVAINDVTVEDARQTAKEIEALGRKSMVVIADVADPVQANEMIEQVVREWGRLDVLVNNAGICKIQPLNEVTAEDWDRTMAVNVKGMFLCSQAAARQMIKQKKGKIINAGSTAGYMQAPLSMTYITSKWAIRGLTRSLAIELAPHNITVNAYCPGVIVTDMIRHIDEKFTAAQGLSAGQFIDACPSQIPLGRVQTEEDVAGLVSYLASPDADNVTGQNIMVNGGMVMC